MRIGIPKETRPEETRVSATPETVKKLIKRTLKVVVERGAGLAAHFPDEAFLEAGAELIDTGGALGAEIVFKLHKPSPPEIPRMSRGALLLCFAEPHQQDGTLEKLAEMGVDTIAMERIPRTSRAQSMDALSSQAGIAGYRAVLEAASHFGKFFPMMMTSAGSSKPCRLAVLGAGVAGLQAIATARRLGAVVEAYDIRPEVREQIESLGAKNIDLEVGEEGRGEGGYARELSEQARQRQSALLSERLKKFDVIVSTANIPGRKAPVLITEEAVRGMRPGSVMVDMAAATGGNCALTEAGKVVTRHGVIIVGLTSFPSLVPGDSSRFYAQNLVNLLDLAWKDRGKGWSLVLDLADDIIAASLVVHQGALCHRS